MTVNTPKLGSPLGTPRAYTRKMCTSCRQNKPISDFHSRGDGTRGVRYECRPCATKRLRTYRRMKRIGSMKCAGKCGNWVKRNKLCDECRVKLQQEMEANAPPLPVKPNICVKHGCGRVMLEQVDRDGLMLFWCARHGEQPVPRIYANDPAHPNNLKPGKSVAHKNHARSA